MRFAFVEDELVSLDELQEQVAEFEDYVQSSDVVAMQSKLSFMSTVTFLLINVSRQSSRLVFSRLLSGVWWDVSMLCTEDRKVESSKTLVVTISRMQCCVPCL